MHLPSEIHNAIPHDGHAHLNVQGDISDLLAAPSEMSLFEGAQQLTKAADQHGVHGLSGFDALRHEENSPWKPKAPQEPTLILSQKIWIISKY